MTEPASPSRVVDDPWGEPFPDTLDGWREQAERQQALRREANERVADLRLRIDRTTEYARELLVGPLDVNTRLVLNAIWMSLTQPGQNGHPDPEADRG